MEYQLRDYEIEPGRLEQFVEEWLARVKPLREAAGFVIEGAWCISHQSRFVWILGWGGPGSLAKADESYYSSPERNRIDPDPARMIRKVGEHTVAKIS